MRSNLDDNVAMRMLLLGGLKLGHAFQTITGNFTIGTDAPTIQEFDATATPRSITLPALKRGLVHVVINGSSSTALLTVKSAAAATVGVLAQGDLGIYICNGSVWYDITAIADASVLQGITAGTAAASKAVVLDANLDIAGIDVAGIARIDLDSATATLSSNAATITKWSAVITSESLTTAHTAAATLVITKTGVAAGDIAMISQVGGTNTGGVPVFKAVCTTNTITITLQNNAIATNAFNGTFIFNLIVFKA